jgi:DNA-directed RNA polymerase subunit RPC12/RpoP
MDKKGWLLRLVISLLVFGIALLFVFSSDAVLFGRDTDLALVFIGAALLFWSLRNLFIWRCPDCHRYFALDIVGTRSIKPEGWFGAEKKKTVYKCRECGHRHKRTITVSHDDL